MSTFFSNCCLTITLQQLAAASKPDRSRQPWPHNGHLIHQSNPSTWPCRLENNMFVCRKDEWQGVLMKQTDRRTGCRWQERGSGHGSRYHRDTLTSSWCCCMVLIKHLPSELDVNPVRDFFCLFVSPLHFCVKCHIIHPSLQ